MRLSIGLASLALIIASSATPAFSASDTLKLSWLLQNPFISTNFSAQEKVTVLEGELIRLYNEFNLDENFDVTCAKTTSNGSFFFTYCQPLFIESAIKKNRNEWRNGISSLKKTAEIFEFYSKKMQELDNIFSALLTSNEKARTLKDEIYQIRNQPQHMSGV
jgi:hypothetical protein